MSASPDPDPSSPRSALPAEGATPQPGSTRQGGALETPAEAPQGRGEPVPPTLDFPPPPAEVVTRSLVETGASAPGEAGLATRPFGPLSAAGVPQAIGPYDLVEEVAVGGMGLVYKARDRQLGRTVALKFLRSGAFARPAEVERFLREARAAARFNHPNVIPIYDVGAQAGWHYYAMAYLPGGTLADHRQRFVGNVTAAVGLMEKVARAVAFLHAEGILHRDLKPANVLLNERGEPVVSDFGLAKLDDGNLERTEPGAVLGTPAYMSPEQAAGRSDLVSARSDVWSLGVMLYELLTGQRPFSATTKEELSFLIRTTDPPSPRTVKPGLSRDLETLVLKCLAREPEERFASAEELADELLRWSRGEPIKTAREPWLRRVRRAARRHPVMATAAVCLVGYVALGAMFFGGERPGRPGPESPRRDAPRDDDFARRLEGRYASGAAVTLIGETGGPEWKQWLVGEGGLVTNLNDRRAPGAFYLQSQDRAALALVPHVSWPRYRVSAEVHTESSDGRGSVGLFFGFRRAAQVDRCGFLLAFVAGEGPKPGAGGLAAPAPAAKVGLSLHWLKPAEAASGWNDRRFQLADRLFPPGSAAGWHRLTLDVTPQVVLLAWDGEPAATQSWAQLQDDAAKLVGVGRVPEPGNAIEPDPHGPLGVSVQAGSAWFRRVVLEPLP